MKTKLKRDRMLKNLENENLFGLAEYKKIESKKPTLDEPALRRYNLNPELNIKKLFKKYGIIDFRKTKKDIDTISSIEDLYNKIICGDSLQVLQNIPDNTIGLIITSPPYWNVVDYGSDQQYGQCSYNQYIDQLLKVWKECNRILKPNGKICINTPIMPISKQVINHQHTRHLKNLNNDIETSIINNIKTLHRYSLYIWKKQTTKKMFGSYPYPPNIYEQNTIEFINVFVKNGSPKQPSMKIKDASKLTEKEWMNLTQQIWSLYPDDVKRRTHPAPFPKSLPNRLIAMYTFKKIDTDSEIFLGDVVLDPFCGVGATCIAAKDLGRNYIGIDLIPDFCIEAATRIEYCIPSNKIFMINDDKKEAAIKMEENELF